MLRGEDRFHAKRDAGISPVRGDGSVCTVDNDVQSAAAEEFAAAQMGVPFNGEVYGTHGDGGRDFRLSLDVEAVWLGRGADGRARQSGHLIVNPHEPHRFGHIYIIVGGSTDEGFVVLGWLTHAELVKLPRKDFGYGERLACPTALLHPIKYLQARKAARARGAT